jgi:hypothetical protein
VTGSARLVVAGGGGDLTINSIDLIFESGAKTQVVGQNAPLRAIAEIAYRANGLLQAEWRLVDSTSIRGGAFERQLAIVRQQLTSGGNGRIRLVSPPLPTDSLGLHRIKLVVTEPDLTFSAPQMQYYVNPTATETLERMLPVVTVLPVDGMPLNTDTRFHWHPVPGAAVYQVEIYSRADGQNPLGNLNPTPLIVAPMDTDVILVSGKLVSGNQTATSLAGFSLGRLEQGTVYRWRVRAISPAGAVIGQSELRDILYP